MQQVLRPDSARLSMHWIPTVSNSCRVFHAGNYCVPHAACGRWWQGFPQYTQPVLDNLSFGYAPAPTDAFGGGAGSSGQQYAPTASTMGAASVEHAMEAASGEEGTAFGVTEDVGTADF